MNSIPELTVSKSTDKRNERLSIGYVSVAVQLEVAETVTSVTV